MTRDNNNTTVKGFITEEHAKDIEATFGKEMADKVNAASEGTTFLNLLFADFAS